jgi:hypothetical protein
VLLVVGSFRNHIKQQKHFSHELHLLVTLKYFGSEGTASSFINGKDGLGIGKGSTLKYVECTVSALLSFQHHSLFGIMQLNIETSANILR